MADNAEPVGGDTMTETTGTTTDTMTQSVDASAPASGSALGVDRLIRVTVVSGTRRADLALPGGLPVAELLPELARTVGALDGQTAFAGYHLVGSDGQRLTGARGLAFQGVEDGGVLTLVAGVDEEPPRVYDDIVEAMADAVEQDTKPWDPAAGRRTALASGALLLALGALALGLQRPDVVAGAAAGVGSLVLVVAAVVLARVRAEHAAAVTLAWAGVVFAAVCGLTAAPAGPLLELPVALGGGGMMVAGAIGLVGLVERRAAMIPAVVVGAVFAACSGILYVSDLSAAAAYSVALVVALLAGSALPWFAVGATDTKVDQAHTHADLTADPEEIDAKQVRRDVRLGHEVLLAVTVTVGLLLVLVGPLAVSLGVSGTLLAVCGCIVLMLRTRQYRVDSEVGAGLVCGVAGLLAVAVGILVEHPDWYVGLAVVLVVTATVLLVLTLVPMSTSIRRGRLGDVAELAALVLLLPLLVFAIGLVGAVRF